MAVARSTAAAVGRGLGGCEVAVVVLALGVVVAAGQQTALVGSVRETEIQSD